MEQGAISGSTAKQHTIPAVTSPEIRAAEARARYRGGMLGVVSTSGWGDAGGDVHLRILHSEPAREHAAVRTAKRHGRGPNGVPGPKVGDDGGPVGVGLRRGSGVRLDCRRHSVSQLR